MRFVYTSVFIIGCILIIIFIGPSPQKPKLNPDLPVINVELNQLDNYVKGKEALHKLKPDNEARIVWANDSLKQKTKYAIVYLHGFSSCQEEGNPTHREIAETFGCNLYLSRLAGHGIDTVDALANFTVDALWESAKEALAIGKLLGDSVILMGTSTGGTVNLILATKYDFIKAIINYSPNIQINNPSAWLLNNPWGLQIARIVTNNTNVIINGESEAFQKYWFTNYRLEAATELEELIEQTMNEETFKQVKIPSLTLYYYKDEKNQDKVVMVEPIIQMHQMLGTPTSQKVLKPVPNAGDHVLSSPIKSKDIKTVYNYTSEFLNKTCNIKIEN